jgi:hypothetical protein
MPLTFAIFACISVSIMKKKKLVVAVTGASGSVYADLLFKKLAQLTEQIQEVAVVMSDNAKQERFHGSLCIRLSKV